MSGISVTFLSPQAVCYSRFWELSFHSVSVRKGLLLTQGGITMLLIDLGFTPVLNEDKFWNYEIVNWHSSLPASFVGHALLKSCLLLLQSSYPFVFHFLRSVKHQPVGHC